MRTAGVGEQGLTGAGPGRREATVRGPVPASPAAPRRASQPGLPTRGQTATGCSSRGDASRRENTGEMGGAKCSAGSGSGSDDESNDEDGNDSGAGGGTNNSGGRRENAPQREHSRTRHLRTSTAPGRARRVPDVWQLSSHTSGAYQSREPPATRYATGIPCDKQSRTPPDSTSRPARKHLPA